MGIWDFIVNNWTVIGSTTVLNILLLKLLDKWIRRDEIILQKTINQGLEKFKSDLATLNNQKQLELDKELEILKNDLKHNLDKEIESLKANLSAENNEKLSHLNRDLERVKSELALQNNRLQAAYSGILKDQIEALKRLYTLILDFEDALSDRKRDKNNYEIFLKPLIVLDNFKNEYYKNAIFIPKVLDEKILDILGFGFQEHYLNLRQKAEEVAISGNLEKANQLSEQAINNELNLRKLRDDFRDEIRLILGLAS
ncbi:hypothetical protein [Acinetobacter sp. B51(2017)]|uniref:hypothetical protein n=1 Tax=Acinetobacter sp. B51(2017) TaxID=2060938 RepID=UPI000F081D32|nr:hypothetical protein [Acinetobacter sp. B51(2017)]